MNKSKLRWIVVGCVIAILFLSVLEFPAPIGFETRPQNDVSMLWLFFFICIVIAEIGTISTIFKFPRIGSWLGIIAGVLNILQVLADQFHLMQPEAAPLGYLLLEDAVALISLILIYFSWRYLKNSSVNLNSQNLFV